MDNLDLVYIIDDDEIIIYLTDQILKSTDFCKKVHTFTAASDALQSLKAALDTKIDVPEAILFDLNMPVMDGGTLLKWVKSSPRLHDLPVLVITSAGNPAKDKDLNELGAFGVLNKPVSPAVLLDALNTFMS